MGWSLSAVGFSFIPAAISFLISKSQQHIAARFLILLHIIFSRLGLFMGFLLDAGKKILCWSWLGEIQSTVNLVAQPQALLSYRRLVSQESII
jgi:hypothetical protein